MSGKRSKARHHAVQAIYQWQVAGHDVSEVDSQFLDTEDLNSFEVEYFKDLLHGVPANLSELDARLKGCVDRSVESIDPVERAILRLGAYEMTRHPEVPYRVVINEAVELAKVFGAEQGHKYVNGVLDKLARRVRKTEISKKK
ncbi:MAG: transcription antitermination factor NusB [Gammaproteobacteria bacterium]|nr:transcription antitermination factor NusB [Gammaproteobacteria bacterium]